MVQQVVSFIDQIKKKKKKDETSQKRLVLQQSQQSSWNKSYKPKKGQRERGKNPTQKMLLPRIPAFISNCIIQGKQEKRTKKKRKKRQNSQKTRLVAFSLLACISNFIEEVLGMAYFQFFRWLSCFPTFLRYPHFCFRVFHFSLLVSVTAIVLAFLWILISFVRRLWRLIPCVKIGTL